MLLKLFKILIAHLRSHDTYIHHPLYATIANYT